MYRGNGNGNGGGIDFVFPISQELKDHGVNGFRVKNENAILTLQNGPKDEMVLFPFYHKNYARSIDKMRVGLESRHVDDRQIAFYCLKITELLLEYVLDSNTGKVTKRPKEELEAWKQTQLIINTINKLRKEYKDIPLSVWETERQKRYDTMRKTITDNTPDAWESIELVLTVHGIQHIRNITLPLIMIQINNPGDWKTFGMDMLKGFPNTTQRDKISNHSWVTHAAKDDPSELENIDLIREMKDSLFLIPDLAPIFMQPEAILVDALSTLIRLADGNGLLTHSGLHGDRGVLGKLMFTMIGSVVQTPPRFHRILSNLGPKIYFFTSNSKETTSQDILNDFDLDDFEIRKELVHDSVISYLTWLEVCPLLKTIDEYLKNVTGEEENEVIIADNNSDPDPGSKLQSKPLMVKQVIDWDKKQDERSALEMIANLAIFLSKIRGSAYAYQDKVMLHLSESKSKDNNRNDDNDNDSSTAYRYEYAHTKPIIEKPKRPATVLRNIAIAHAFELHGRNHITSEDLLIIVKVVLSSANRERIATIKSLLLAPGDISGLIENQLDTTRQVDMKHLVGTNYLISNTGISKSQLHRIVSELETLGLIDIYKAGSSHQNYIIFKKRFSWLYDIPFQDLLKKCYPSDSGSDSDATEGEQV
jgi:hypothetical protein